MYSTAVKLPSWIPEIVVTFLTKTVLVESTTWVKREAEMNVVADAKFFNAGGDSGCYRHDTDVNKLVYQTKKNTSCVQMEKFTVSDEAEALLDVSEAHRSNNSWDILIALLPDKINDKYVVLSVGMAIGMIAASVPVVLSRWCDF